MPPPLEASRALGEEIAATVNGHPHTLLELARCWGLSRRRAQACLDRGVAPYWADGKLVRLLDGTRLRPSRAPRPKTVRSYPGEGWFPSCRSFARATGRAPTSTHRLLTLDALPPESSYRALCYGGRWIYRARRR